MLDTNGLRARAFLLNEGYRAADEKRKREDKEGILKQAKLGKVNKFDESAFEEEAKRRRLDIEIEERKAKIEIDKIHAEKDKKMIEVMAAFLKAIEKNL